ncbi:SH3 domain-containing protein, partial [Salmonella enterica subsp. enterica]|nr:SH3 domain-containing protein [Salmonella enterica subsp. enterica]
LVVASAAQAQESPQTAGEPEVFQVVGLAPDDLLNLRATATAGGMMIGRIPNGAYVRNHGCAEVEKVNWCKISDADNPSIMGWAAARYLEPADAAFHDPGPVDGEPTNAIVPARPTSPPASAPDKQSKSRSTLEKPKFTYAFSAQY